MTRPALPPGCNGEWNMKQCTVKRRFYSWEFSKLEQFLNDQSEAGLQLTAATHRRQSFTEDPSQRYIYRIGCCEGADGSASSISYLSRQEIQGWELVCREGDWLYFRKPWDETLPDDAFVLEDGQAPVEKNLRAFIKRLERIRLVFLVLTVLPILAGYAFDNMMVIRIGALPLIVALLVTLCCKKIEEALRV